ncbi:MAG: SPOR domain-containing protein [Oligoflexia bacterium]|nr:SPOR domain-containing protein [Oligoflexia bacterium]
MDKKPRFFIYDRREVAVLVLLGLMVAVFAFTLGVHLGKHAGIKNSAPQVAENGHKTEAATEPSQPATPTQEEIDNRIRARPPAPADVVHQATQEEVARTGIGLDSPRQTKLPESVAQSGATQSQSAPAERADGGKRYAIQIGSYPSLIMAQDRAHELEVEGIKAKIRKADIKGIGIRYRVMVGEFRTRHGAEKAGEIYRDAKKIDAFIIAPIQG